MITTRAQYAAWWEANEQAGAELTEAVMRHDCDTDRDRDDTNCGPDERDIVMESDEGLAVLRYMALSEHEAAAWEAVRAEVARLRTQRQEALDAASAHERAAWQNGGDHAVRSLVRSVRDALGVPR
jgi:hypothetical protein